MPATKSAKKRLKTDKKKKSRNLRVKKALKSSIKELNKNITDKKQAEAKESLVKTESVLDRSASKGLIHKNTASRKKSRLAKQINKLGTA